MLVDEIVAKLVRECEAMQIRFAEAADAGVIHAFISELAVYEKEPDAVEVTPEELASQLESDPPPSNASSPKMRAARSASRCSFRATRPGGAVPASTSRTSLSRSASGGTG